MESPLVLLSSPALGFLGLPLAFPCTTLTPWNYLKPPEEELCLNLGLSSYEALYGLMGAWAPRPL